MIPFDSQVSKPKVKAVTVCAILQTPGNTKSFIFNELGRMSGELMSLAITLIPQEVGL